jgi:hypothetical protein
MDDLAYKRQLEELAATTKANGRLEMATEVLAWAKRNERGISDIAMTELVRLCTPKLPVKA